MLGSKSDKKTNRTGSENLIWRVLIICTVLLRFLNLYKPLYAEMHAFRQTETAIVIQRYLMDGWSLFHYEIPVFGSPWEVPLECPIYQTFIYFIMRIFHLTNIDLCCKIVGVVLFCCSGWVLYKLTELISEKQTAKIITLVYFLLPYNIYWSRAALIDYMSVGFGLLYCYGLLNWLYTGNRKSYILAMLIGIAGYLLKATTLFGFVAFLSIYILIYLFKQMKEQKPQDGSFAKQILVSLKENGVRLLLLAGLCIIPVCFGYAWTYYADAIKNGNPYTEWLTSGNLTEWNYGTWQQRLDLLNWQVIGIRIAAFGGGVIITAFLTTWYIVRRNKQNIILFVTGLTASLFSVSVLFNLYVIHNYYLIAITPFVAIVIGVIARDLLQTVMQNGKCIQRVIAAVLLCCTICGMVLANEEYLEGTFSYTENSSVGLYINQITEQDENILIEGEDWNPTTLYYAERKGQMWLPEIGEEEFKSLCDENYTTLIAHDTTYLNKVASMSEIFVEYPVFYREAAYIAKYYKKGDFYTAIDNHEFKQCEVWKKESGNADAAKTYDISDLSTDYLLIEYQPVTECSTVEVRMINSAGMETVNEVLLLPGKQKIYYNCKEQMKGASAIQFVTDMPLHVLK